MKLHNMTQTEFLELAGFPRTTFQRWWNGQTDPRVSEVEACLNVFGYTLKPTPTPDDPKEK
jgi:transcriptional regulator with XRE-family HTH domain